MRQLVPFWLAAAITVTGVARAQPAQPAPPPKAPAENKAPDDEGDDEDEPETKSKDTALPEEPPKDQEPPPPVLPPPRPDEEKPGPYRGSFQPIRKERKLEVGPDIGITARSAEGDDVSYSAGFTWGAHLRIELVHFLGLRLYFNNTSHAVDVPNGALTKGSLDLDPMFETTEVEQEDLKVTVLGVRLEPTWVVTPELRLWLGLGVAWGRVFAEEPHTKNPSLASADRTGVLLEWTGSLGASYDLIPSWLAATLLVNGGVVSSQSGDVFDRKQAIRQDLGTIAYLDGLPEFGSTLSVLIGLGIVL